MCRDSPCRLRALPYFQTDPAKSRHRHGDGCSFSRDVRELLFYAWAPPTARKKSKNKTKISQQGDRADHKNLRLSQHLAVNTPIDYVRVILQIVHSKKNPAASSNTWRGGRHPFEKILHVDCVQHPPYDGGRACVHADIHPSLLTEQKRAHIHTHDVNADKQRVNKEHYRYRSRYSPERLLFLSIASKFVKDTRAERRHVMSTTTAVPTPYVRQRSSKISKFIIMPVSLCPKM